MKNIILLIALSILTFFFSCNKELERPDREFPGVYTGTVKNINNNGFEVDFDIRGSLDDIIEYGFVWNQSNIRQEPTIDDLRLVIKEQPQGRTVTEQIKWDLPTGFIVLRGYVRTNSKFIYGPSIFVNSLGGSAPTVQQVTPTVFTPGDTLCITGEGFSTQDDQNNVTIDGKEVTIVESGNDKIKVIAPTVDSADPILRVTSWGKTTNATIDIGTSAPFINSLSSDQSGMDQLITIKGGNFSTDNSINKVTFTGQHLSKEGTVISSSSDSLIVSVPNLSTSFSNTTYTIIVEVGNEEAQKENCFEFLKPNLSDDQEMADLCDTITITGNNFSPIPENNSFVTTTEDATINFVKSSTTKLKFIFQENIQFTNGNSNPNFIDLKLDANNHFDDVKLQIAEAPVTSPSSTVITSADTDITIEISGNGFSSFASQYTAVVTPPSPFIPSFEAQVTRAQCDTIIIEIDKSNISGGLALDETWELFISHPSGKITHDVILQIQGIRAPLTSAPTDLIDFFARGRAFASDTKGYYLGTQGSIYSYDPSLDSWGFVANTLEGMNFSPVNNQVIGQLAIHTWDNNNELQVAALDLNSNTWSEYATPVDGIKPLPGNYFDFTFNDAYYIAGVDINEVWQFTPSTNTWVQKNLGPSPNEGFQNGRALQIGDKVYLYDGNKIIIYDPVADTWTTGATNNANLVFDEYTTAAINDKLYLISPQNSGASTVYSEYDPTADQWTTLEELSDRSHQNWGFLFTIGNKAYMYQSQHSQNGLPYSLSNFWSYTPE